MARTFYTREQLVEIARRGGLSGNVVIREEQVRPDDLDLAHRLFALSPAIRESFRRPVYKMWDAEVKLTSISLVDTADTSLQWHVIKNRHVPGTKR